MVPDPVQAEELLRRLGQGKPSQGPSTSLAGAVRCPAEPLARPPVPLLSSCPAAPASPQNSPECPRRNPHSETLPLTQAAALDLHVSQVLPVAQGVSSISQTKVGSQRPEHGENLINFLLINVIQFHRWLPVCWQQQGWGMQARVWGRWGSPALSPCCGTWEWEPRLGWLLGSPHGLVSALSCTPPPSTQRELGSK